MKYFYHGTKNSRQKFVVLDFDLTLINEDLILNRNLVNHLTKFHGDALFLVLSARPFYQKKLVLEALGELLNSLKIIDIHLIGSTTKKASLVKLLTKWNTVTYYDDLDYLGFAGNSIMRDQFIADLKVLDNLVLITDHELNDIITLP